MEITKQTTMLSLNASIEAARAGESGKVFAVVAKNIGDLAKHSSEVANEIKKAAQNVIQSVEELAGESEKMIDFANTTAMNGYQELADMSQATKQNTDKTDSMMQEIADLTAKLDEDITRIKEAAQDVNTAVEENAQAITKAATRTEGVAENIADINDEALANQLDNEVQKFKL